MTTAKASQRGFTLIELIIFIVVVGVGLAGILSVMNTVVKSSADPMVRKQSIAIAESLLEEILLKEYGVTACAGSSDERKNWEYVCDYNGYTTTIIVNSQDDGAVGLDRYSIAPAVKVSLVSAAENQELNDVAAKKVTVSVTGPGGNTISLTGYRTEY